MPLGRLIDVGGDDALRDDADLSEKFAAAGTGGGQNQTADEQRSYLNRKVMRPFVRS